MTRHTSAEAGQYLVDAAVQQRHEDRMGRLDALLDDYRKNDYPGDGMEHEVVRLPNGEWLAFKRYTEDHTLYLRYEPDNAGFVMDKETVENLIDRLTILKERL